MADANKKLEYAIGKLIDVIRKDDSRIIGLLGTYINGSQTVVVPNRPNYVFVRIGGNQAETIQAFNDSVPPEFDLKVELIKDIDASAYKVVGRDRATYTSWNGNPFIALHGRQHSFGSNSGEGVDPVFIYKRQMFQPLGVHPITTGNSMSVYVEADFYTWNNTVNYFGGTGTQSLAPAKPTDITARYVTIYLDGNLGVIGFISGTTFSTFPYPPQNLIDFIPEISPSQGFMLAAVYLTSGTTRIDWDNLFDIRSLLNDGSIPRYSPLTITATYTGSITDDVILCNASGTNINYILPTAINNSGKPIRVKKIDLSTGSITVRTFGSQTIDGGATRIIQVAYESIDLISDGFNWWIF